MSSSPAEVIDRLHERMGPGDWDRWKSRFEDLAWNEGVLRILSGSERILEQPEPARYSLSLDGDDNVCCLCDAHHGGMIGYIEAFDSYVENRRLVQKAKTLLLDNCDEAVCFAIHKINSPKKAYGRLCKAYHDCDGFIESYMKEFDHLRFSGCDHQLGDFVQALEKLRADLAYLHKWEKSDLDMISIIVRELTPVYEPFVTAWEKSLALGEECTLERFKDRLFAFRDVKPPDKEALYAPFCAMATAALAARPRPEHKRDRSASEFGFSVKLKDLKLTHDDKVLEFVHELKNSSRDPHYRAFPSNDYDMVYKVLGNLTPAYEPFVRAYARRLRDHFEKSISFTYLVDHLLEYAWDLQHYDTKRLVEKWSRPLYVEILPKKRSRPMDTEDSNDEDYHGQSKKRRSEAEPRESSSDEIGDDEESSDEEDGDEESSGEEDGDEESSGEEDGDEQSGDEQSGDEESSDEDDHGLSEESSDEDDHGPSEERRHEPEQRETSSDED